MGNKESKEKMQSLEKKTIYLENILAEQYNKEQIQ